jgi:hypothetical protein
MLRAQSARSIVQKEIGLERLRPSKPPNRYVEMGHIETCLRKKGLGGNDAAQPLLLQSTQILFGMLCVQMSANLKRDAARDATLQALDRDHPDAMNRVGRRTPAEIDPTVAVGAIALGVGIVDRAIRPSKPVADLLFSLEAQRDEIELHARRPAGWRHRSLRRGSRRIAPLHLEGSDHRRLADEAVGRQRPAATERILRNLEPDVDPAGVALGKLKVAADHRLIRRGGPDRHLLTTREAGSNNANRLASRDAWLRGRQRE